MITKKITNPLKASLRIFLLLAIVTLSLGPGGTSPAYAAPSDSFAGAITITDSLPYTDTYGSATSATEENGEPKPITCTDANGDPVNIINNPANTLWYKFTATTSRAVSLDTFGSNYDTFIAVWTGTSVNALSPADTPHCNDDTWLYIQSAITFDAVAGTTYYIEVGHATNDSNSSLVFHATNSNLDLDIGTGTSNKYILNPGDILSRNYLSLLDGPVKVISTNATDMFTTQIVTSGGSYNELAGYPVDQFTTEYWFPYYDHGYPNVAGNKMRTWILVGNPDPSLTANVEIRIGGVLKNDPANPSNFFFSIPPGGNVTPRWLGLVGGPVQVKSTNGVNIFASERVFTVPYNSFNEVMGYPANQFTTEYWFPWYDTVYMDTYVMVGNTSSSISANVDIYIGATKKGSYSILPNATLKQRYADTVNGPLRVVSTNGVNIVTSEFTLSGTENSFNEVMGYPFNQFDTEYWYPYYDHGYPSVNGNKMRTWILVGNPSSTLTANVQIYIKGNLQTVPGSNPATSTFVIPPSGNVTPRWMGSIAGPVRVVSDIPIFTSERVFTVPTNAFNEFMGIPFSQMTTEYWFPWYDSVYMNNKILVSKP